MEKIFSFGRVHGIDIIDKSALAERRIQIHHGSQSNISFLETMMEKVLPVTIINDDGSHISKDVITTFKFLFPKLRKGGWYVVEDIQTSYWREFEGDPENLKNPRTSMNFSSKLRIASIHQNLKGLKVRMELLMVKLMQCISIII